MVTIAFVGLVVLGGARCGPDDALVRLPVAERRAFYERSLANLEATCRPQDRQAVLEYCTEQARLIVRLDECDAACREMALSVLLPATR
jgi:hypothetical protein